MIQEEVNKTLSCNIDGKQKMCCSTVTHDKSIDYNQHWNDTYTGSEEHNLGWYESDQSTMLKLLDRADLEPDSAILIAGAGSTNLVDTLLEKGYTQLIATDISDIAVNRLRQRTGEREVMFIVDDLTNPTKLNELTLVDCWIDRAVLHFFVEEEARKNYFILLKRLLNKGAYVLLAEFALDGASNCSGLPVCRYSVDMMQEELGNEFELIDSFNYTYRMPSGDTRPYNYALFRRRS